MARAIRNAIRASRFARTPIFLAPQADSHESLESPIHANHATKVWPHTRTEPETTKKHLSDSEHDKGLNE